MPDEEYFERVDPGHDRYEEFLWGEVATGIWERDVDEPERYYCVMAKLYEGSGQRALAITCHITVSFAHLDGDDNQNVDARVDAALQTAWLKLRHHHPTIASQVRHDPARNSFTRVYQSAPTMAELIAWLSHSYRKIYTSAASSAWANAGILSPALPTLFVLRSLEPASADKSVPITRHVILRCPGDVMDDAGALALLGNLARIAAQAYASGTSFPMPEFGDNSEFETMSPPFRMAARLPRDLSVPQSRRLTEMRAANAQQFTHPAPLLRLPFRLGPTAPGRHQRAFTKLDVRQTRQFFTGCACLTLTPAMVFHSVIPIMIRNLMPRAPAPRDMRFVMAPVVRDMRPKLSEPYSTPTQHPAAQYQSVAGSDLVVDIAVPTAGDAGDKVLQQTADGEDFFRIIQLVKAFINTMEGDPDDVAFTPIGWATRTPVLQAMSGYRPVPAPDAVPPITLSMLGVVDGPVPAATGPVAVSDPWVTREELRNGLALSVTVFQGELCLNAAYNEAWHDRVEVEAWLKMLIELVKVGLGAYMFD